MVARIPLKLNYQQREWLRRNIAAAYLNGELYNIAVRWVQLTDTLNGRQHGVRHPFQATNDVVLAIARDDPLYAEVQRILNNATYEERLVALYLAAQERINRK